VIDYVKNKTLIGLHADSCQLNSICAGFSQIADFLRSDFENTLKFGFWGQY